VLLLHGLLDTGASWERVAAGLPEYRVIAPDARGHGRSDHVGPGAAYHFADYVRDLDALVEELGGPVHLVGHSMGGTIASMYAGLVPDQVRSLCLVEGIGPPTEPDAAAVDRFRAHLDQMRAPPQPKVMATIPDAVERLVRVNRGLSPEEAQRIARRNTRKVPSGWIWTWDPLHRTRSPIGFDVDRYLGMLKQIVAPTRVVLCSESWYLGVDRLQERIDACSAERVELPGGHTPHLDQTDALVSVIRSTIQSANSCIE